MCGADVRLFWHPQGDYLAVQVDRFTKTRKSTFTAFELFSVKEKDIPMEVPGPFTPLHTDRLSHVLCVFSYWTVMMNSMHGGVSILVTVHREWCSAYGLP